ncbi:MAG: hypothetical protein Q4F57_05245 [Weeksellaceae bacterium]|nr:hypothetical protein [Weeksellaceae bacterium]
MWRKTINYKALQQSIRQILSSNLVLYLYHLAITCAAYYYYLIGKAKDVELYWLQKPEASQWVEQGVIPLREYFILYLNYPFVQWLHLPVEFGFLLYSTIGFVGILYWKRLVTYYVPSGIVISGYNLLPIVYFLPNQHFFTSLLGKEPLVFLAIAGALHSLLVRKHIGIAILFAILLAIVRPYMLPILLMALVPYIIVQNRHRLPRLYMFLATALVVGVASIWMLLKSSWLQVFDFSRIQALQQAHINVFAHTSGYIPIHEYWFPAQWFAFNFRPLPLEHQATFSWLISVENLVLLAIFVFGIVCMFLVKKALSLWRLDFWVFVLLSLLSVALMAQIYANYGLLVRMKIMFQPFSLIIPLYYLAQRFAKTNK